MLPRHIEISPLKRPFQAEVAVPGSKSMTNRALILAALRDGPANLRGALWSDDTEVMTDCLRKLGFEIVLEADPSNEANRTIHVTGHGGWIPASSDDLYVGNAGTAARFLTAFCALGRGGEFHLRGDERMGERPMEELFRVLGEWGVEFEFEREPGHLPVRMKVPEHLRVPAVVSVDLTESSQFASALELVRSRLGFSIDAKGFDDDHYYKMTQTMVKRAGDVFVIEPDASSASYFWAAASLAPGGRVTIRGWPAESIQVDAKFQSVCERKPMKISRRTDLGDSVMMAAVMGSFWPKGVAVTDAGRLRRQETDRLAALEKELTKCGARVRAHETWIEVQHVPALRGAHIETYKDHRMAMAFSVLGLKTPGMVIANPSCVSKTFPNFFETLDRAARECGAEPVVLDARSHQPLF